jgi:hypothetical protein
VGALVGSKIGVTSKVTFTTATRVGWWLVTGCGALVVVLGLVGTSTWAHASARRTAVELNPEYFEGRAA